MSEIKPIGGATGGSRNLSTSLSNVARLGAHPNFVWVFNANCDGTITYNDSDVLLCICYFSVLNSHFISLFFVFNLNIILFVLC
jgi:hypothetical protein